MLGGWRAKLREAEQAFRRGELDEASRMLTEAQLREFLPAQRLLAKVAGQMAARGEARMIRGESMAGWRDLESAAHFGADPIGVAKLREKMIAQLLEEVEQYVTAGDYRAALARLQELERRGATSTDTRRWRQVAEKMALAQRLARRGRFTEAEQELAVAVQLSGGLRILNAWTTEFNANAGQLRELSAKLHQALSSGNWQSVLEHADAILEIAPDDRPARDARAKAWEAVGMRLAETIPPGGDRNRVVGGASGENMSDSDHGLSQSQSGASFVLWVDAVGGYLVCLGDEVTLGQPGAGQRPDVALLADLSRLHARIRRDGEGYLLEPVRTTKLSGQVVHDIAPLADGALIELGAAVRLRFCKQHALSETARLEFVSRHRTQPPVDGVLLMADSCVLGPSPTSNIVCPEWTHEVVIYRQGGELYCRAPGTFQVDGIERHGRAAISTSAHVSGPDFSFTLEPIRS